jgi:outer membrane biosynthesis protein TonB
MARSTKATKPKLPITDKTRRHADPPNLWLTVATGSVVFHLLLAVIILPLQARRVGEESQLNPVAIDLVELDPAETPVAIAHSTTQSDAIELPQAPPPAQSIEAFPSPPPEPEHIPAPSAEPSAEPIPAPPIEEPLDRQPPVPSESEQPPDSLPELDSGETDADADQGSDADAATADPASADDSSGAGEQADPDSSSTGDPGLPGVIVDSTVNPTGWATSAVVSQRPDRPFDLPTQLATVKPGFERLPEPTHFGCPITSGTEPGRTEQEQYAQYLAEAAPYLDTPVSVNITVEADGQVSDAYIGGTTSGNNAHEQLAVCLVTNWLEFNPALREGEPWASDNQQVTITISSTR